MYIYSNSQRFDRLEFQNPGLRILPTVTSKAKKTTHHIDMNRKIQDIAPLLADDFVDFEIDLLTIENYRKLLDQEKHRIGLYYKYIPLLHDSGVIETKIMENKFSLTLNEFTRFVFASALIDKKGLNIDKEKMTFPLQIDFDIINLTFNKVDDSGLIQPIEPTDLGVYLYEQIVSIDNDKLEIGMIFWKDYENKPGEHILILLTARNINIIEKQDEKWIHYFGESFNKYLDFYKLQLESGEYFSDQWICEKMIDKLDKE